MIRHIPACNGRAIPVSTRAQGGGSGDRRGATLVEGAILLSTLLVLVLGSLDLSLAVWQ